MQKVTIEFEDIFDKGRSFGDCLNDLLDKYYSSGGAEAPFIFLIIFHFMRIYFVPFV